MGGSPRKVYTCYSFWVAIIKKRRHFQIPIRTQHTFPGFNNIWNM